jgi:hypothetical protein
MLVKRGSLVNVCHRPISITTLAVALALLASAAAPAAGTPKWRLVARTGVPVLVAVDALSASSVWAAGSGNGRPVVVHWLGGKLTVRSLPWTGARLSGIAALSQSDVWAVGATNDHKPFAVHFDGRSWHRASLPTVTNGALRDVAALAPDDVWAVGHAGDGALVLHFDSQQWRIVDTGAAVPRPGELTSIDSASADDVWAFGSTGPHVAQAYGFGPVVLRWHRGRWTRIRTPIGDSAYKGYLNGALDIAPSGEVWAVQAENTGSCEGCLPQFLRWSGPARNVRTFYEPDFPGDEPSVYDIAALSRASVWVVGEVYGADSDNYFPLIAHGNGKSWQIQTTPFSGLKNRSLNAISPLSSTDIWAVGDHLIARYSR